jgi:hypothetical protein
MLLICMFVRQASCDEYRAPAVYERRWGLHRPEAGLALRGGRMVKEQKLTDRTSGAGVEGATLPKLANS